MNTIFITGTAGSGKSLLTSKIVQWYTDNGAYAITLNLDPGVIHLPYKPDVDIRNYVDIEKIMTDFSLGPNGSLIMAADLVATKLDEIQHEVDSLNPDYVIVDTPGQIELFVYRVSGPYFVTNFRSDNKVNIFTLDGMLVSTPINYVSIALIAASVRMRLRIAQIDVMTKRDLVSNRIPDIMKWSSSRVLLEEAIDSETGQQPISAEYKLLSRDILRGMYRNGVIQTPIPYSNLTMNGMLNLTGSLSRVLSQGEEKFD
ncbi:MAG: ATP/GTP-binding protein [Thermoproteota archaeon]|nr:ATP/GTP-binding protein [Thermoproteota archaeon]